MAEGDSVIFLVCGGEMNVLVYTIEVIPKC